MAGRSWDIVGVLGEGGFSVVYEAIEHGDGPPRRVALKVLRDDPPAPVVLERLRHEVFLSRAAGDRAFVVAEPVLRIDGRWSTVLPVIDGIAPPDSMPPRAALELVAEVARALCAAGERIGADNRPLGLVHRDLGPANLRVTRTGEVRILDLGLGWTPRGPELTRDGSVAGTPDFVAPERFLGKDGPPSDVFGLGVTLGRIVARPRAERTLTHAEVSPDLRGAEGAAALAHAMRSPEPADRPSMAEVERRASALAAAAGGPGLREWAQRTVPPRAPTSTRDPWVGRRVHPDLAPAPRADRPWGLVVVAAAGIAAAGIAGSYAARWSIAPPPPAPVPVAIRPAPPAPPPAVPAPDPVAAQKPAPATAVASVWVRTRPWGTVAVGERTWVTEDRSMALPVGRRVLRLVSHDGAYRHDWPVDVAQDGPNAFCWDFVTEAPCSR